MHPTGSQLHVSGLKRRHYKDHALVIFKIFKSRQNFIVNGSFHPFIMFNYSHVHRMTSHCIQIQETSSHHVCFLYKIQHCELLMDPGPSVKKVSSTERQIRNGVGPYVVIRTLTKIWQDLSLSVAPGVVEHDDMSNYPPLFVVCTLRVRKDGRHFRWRFRPPSNHSFRDTTGEGARDINRYVEKDVRTTYVTASRIYRLKAITSPAEFRDCTSTSSPLPRMSE